MPLLGSLWTAFLTVTCLALPNAFAAPASIESAGQLLVVERTAEYVERQLAKTLEQIDAAADTIDDPATRKTRKEAAVWVRGLLDREFTWDKLEPKLVTLYTKQYSQTQIDELLAYYRTPAGRLWLDKATPVLLDISTDWTAQTRRRVDQIADALDANRPLPPLPRPAALAATPRNKAARQFVDVLADVVMKGEFNESPNAIERMLRDSFEESIASSNSVDRKKLENYIKRFRRAVDRDIRLDDWRLLATRALADSALTTDELLVLAKDTRRPQRVAQIRHAATVGEALQEELFDLQGIIGGALLDGNAPGTARASPESSFDAECGELQLATDEAGGPARLELEDDLAHDQAAERLTIRFEDGPVAEIDLTEKRGTQTVVVDFPKAGRYPYTVEGHTEFAAGKSLDKLAGRRLEAIGRGTLVIRGPARAGFWNTLGDPADTRLRMCLTEG